MRCLVLNYAAKLSSNRGVKSVLTEGVAPKHISTVGYTARQIPTGQRRAWQRPY